MTKKELDNPHYRKLVKEGKPLDTENEKAALKLIEDAATELLGSAKTTEDVRSHKKKKCKQKKKHVIT
jgi:hypothetical protein